jgi:hypothetical protein
MAPRRKGEEKIERQVTSFEHLLLRLGTGESSEIAAYRKWLESCVPHMAGTVPGGREIAKMAGTYLARHQKKGEDLPFFSPYSIKDLNMFATVMDRNFVVYRHATKVDTDKLQVVADTRLFSTCKFGGPCHHILLRKDGTAYELKDVGKRPIRPMAGSKMGDARTFASPMELALSISPKMRSADKRAVAEGDFLDLRSSSKMLNGLARAVGRPVRLLAVDCTSRFKKREANECPRMWKVHASEQRESMGPEKGPAVDVYLVPWLNTVVGVTDIDSKYFGFASAAGKKPFLNTLQDEVRAKVGKRKAPEENDDDDEEDDDVGKRLRLTPHTRVDDCCSLQVGEEPCDACRQVEDDFVSAKKPPIDSSRGMYNPAKNCTSLLAEAKGLGLCDIFPDLEENLGKANLASVTALDIETLSVELTEGNKSGSRFSDHSAGQQRGGTSTISKHVLFMLGAASFRLKAIDRFSRNGLLWRVNQEGLRYKEFSVTTRKGVPSQSDVHECVAAWLDYMIERRRCTERYKRRLLGPVMEALKLMSAVSDEVTQTDSKNRAPSFSQTIFGRVLARMESLCSEINVVTYNGTK